MNLSPKEKPYLRAVEEFLQQLDGHEVDSVLLFALGKGDYSHLLCSWRCEPWIMAQMAGILQLSATQQLMKDYEEVDDYDNPDEDLEP